jgi:hypothetical protein
MLLFSPVCFAQSVRIRVVNGKNGKALPKQPISVQFIYQRPPTVSTPLHLETDPDGEAYFSIPQPSPAHLNVQVAPKSEYWHCACGMMAETQTVVLKGIVQIVRQKRDHPSLRPEPRYITFVLRPYSFGEVLLYPFMKGLSMRSNSFVGDYNTDPSTSYFRKLRN